MKPGVYRDIPNSDYHSGPGDSKSGLDLVRKSPARLKRARSLPPSARVPTPAQVLGTAFHMLVLEPARFAAEYALPFIPPEGALATTEHLKGALESAGVAFKQSSLKAVLEALVREHVPHAVLLTDARAEYDAENRGRTIIELDTWNQLHNMRDAVMAHHSARKLLSAPGEAELSAYWQEPIYDRATGEQLIDECGNPATMLLRCRPDYWRHDGIVVDLKSCSPGGAAEDEFARSIGNYRYHVQHPMYLRGAKAALAETLGDPTFKKFSPPRTFVFIAVENDACVVDGVAMGVATFQLKADSVALGTQEMREDIATLYRCTKEGRFPGYSEQVQPIELPAYKFTQALQRAGASD